MTTDAASRFSTELAVLRDSVVQAIRQDNVADLKDGLELYSSLVGTVLEQFRRYQALVGPSGPGLFSFYGREMSWLEDDIRTFLKNAVSDPGSDVTQETLGFVLGLIRDAFVQRELPAFGSFLRHFTLAWHEGRRVLEGKSWERLRGNLLLTLENFGDYWIGRDLTGAGASTQDPMPYAERLLSEIAQLMKAAVDEGSTDDLRAASHTLHETMRYAVNQIDRDDGDWPFDDRDEHPVTTAKAAAALAVEAWVHFRHSNGKTDLEDALRLIEVLRAGATQSTWLGYLTSVDHRTSDWLGATTWETTLWEDRRGGILSFDGFVTRAFVYQLLQGRVTIPAEIHDPSRGLRYRVEQLRNSVDEIAKGPVDPLLPAGSDPSRVAAVRAQLDGLIQQLQVSEDEQLAALPLIPDKVARFRSAVVAAWTGPRHLRQLGSESAWDPETSSSPEPQGFGINRLTPKDYFVDQPGVHADPEDLGREYGDGLGRGEDEMIFAAVFAQLPRRQTTLDSLAVEVEQAVAGLLERDLSPVVLVVNSWDMMSALRDHVEPEGAWATADLDDAPRLRGTEAPVLLRYGESRDICVVADFKRVFEVEYREPTPELPNDAIASDGRILTGVELIDTVRAMELVRSNADFKRGESAGVELDDEAAARNVQKSVQVRVLEWVRIRVLDPGAGVVLEVDGVR